MLFLFHTPHTTKIYALSLHDALPILVELVRQVEALDAGGELGDGFGVLEGGDGEGAGVVLLGVVVIGSAEEAVPVAVRSEEHTSELQSQSNLVCRLLLEKKKKTDGSS